MNTEALWLSLLIIVPVFLLGWWLQLKSKNAGWVDVYWSFGVALTGLAFAFFGNGDSFIRATVAVIYVLWFGRLGYHLLRRLSGEPEDGRYAYMREWAGPRAKSVFFVFYLMQASWVWIFALPAWLVSQAENPPMILYLAGLLIVVIAWLGESISDHQLNLFKADSSNRGKTCRSGLWRYSRHPNYFFEWLHWFAYPLLGWSALGGEWLWLAPLVVFVFLYFVTGIPFTEQQAIRSRGEDYREYQRTTSMFIPWKPRH